MKKIGLCIQFEGVDNYGTVLQAMANRKAIEDLGCETRIIRYKRKYDLSFILNQLPRIFDLTHWKIVIRRKKRKKALKNNKVFREHRHDSQKAFKEYRKDFFPETCIDQFYGYDELRKKSCMYNAVLVGSDQLWLPTGLRSNFYNLMFAQDGVKRISYSTSFGVSSIPKVQYKATKEYLNKIDYLSVREVAGQKIIRDLTGREAFLVCDPVMLLSSEEWNNICNVIPLPKDMPEDDYLLCYFLGGNESSRRTAADAARKLGVKVVSISYMDDYFSVDDGFGDYVPSGIRPEQFVNLIKNAKYVMTDSFHGTAFSIIFEKQFLSTYRFDTESKLSKNSRIDNVLSKFNLMKRLYIHGDAASMFNDEIDYQSVTNIRDNWRKESLAFLKNALGE